MLSKRFPRLLIRRGARRLQELSRFQRHRGATIEAQDPDKKIVRDLRRKEHVTEELGALPTHLICPTSTCMEIFMDCDKLR